MRAIGREGEMSEPEGYMEEVRHRNQISLSPVEQYENRRCEQVAEADTAGAVVTATEGSGDLIVGIPSGACKICGDHDNSCKVACVKAKQRECNFGSFCLLLNNGGFQEKISDLHASNSTQTLNVMSGESQRQQHIIDHGSAQFASLPVRDIVGDCSTFDAEQRSGSVLWWSSCHHHLHVCEDDQIGAPSFFPKLSCRSLLKNSSHLQELDVSDTRTQMAPQEDTASNPEDVEEKILESKASMAGWSSTACTIDESVTKDDTFHEDYSKDGLKELHLDKEGQARYTLRSNPKRSWRLRDQEFCVEGGSTSSVVVSESFNVSFVSLPSIAPPPLIRKAACKIVDEKPEKHACTECGREFTSCKALFGHMRCHPEREWRGIQRPEGKSLPRGESGSNSGLQHVVHRKKPRTNVAHGATVAEAGMQHPKEERHKILRDVDGKFEASSMEEPLEDFDMIESLLMLARAGSGKQFEQASSKVNVARMMEKHHEAHVLNKQRLETHRLKGKSVREMRPQKSQAKEGHLKGEYARTHGTQWNTHENEEHSDEPDWSDADVEFTSSLRKKLDFKLEGLAQGSEGGTGVAKEQMEFTSAASVPGQHKYECMTCNIIFKSYQSLGGHRASHKKVKGCFARNQVKGFMNPNDARDGVPIEDGMKGSEGFEKFSELQTASRCELKLKRCCTAEGEDFERENLEKQQAIAKKVDGCHECSVCHRVFASGPALGGHKRCHWGGAGGLEASGKANNNSEQQASMAPQGLVEAKPTVVHCPDLNVPVRTLSDESVCI